MGYAVVPFWVCPAFCQWILEILPRGSKYPIFKVSGPQKGLEGMVLESRDLNIGYLDRLGLSTETEAEPLDGAKGFRASGLELVFRTQPFTPAC